ncbi:hypothetical protein A2U01_0100557, partial [Trifolium medium]|nr:hypothetical protein [Trifolium medium]
METEQNMRSNKRKRKGMNRKRRRSPAAKKMEAVVPAMVVAGKGELLSSSS